MNIIQTLRQRPEEERRAFALVFAGGVAFVLFLIWGMAFFKVESSQVAVVKTKVYSSKKDAQDIKSTFIKFATQISSQYSDLQKTISQNESSAPSKNNATISGGNKKKYTILGPFQISTSTTGDTQKINTNILNTESNTNKTK